MKTKPMVKLRLRELRAKLKWTQAQLAEKAKLTKTTICNLESEKVARIELTTIAQLCDALDCSPNDLFELPNDSQEKVVLLQKMALKKLIGTIEYSKPVDPDTLDADLADIIDLELQEANLSTRKRAQS